jgi:hypothetical protein
MAGELDGRREQRLNLFHLIVALRCASAVLHASDGTA